MSTEILAILMLVLGVLIGLVIQLHTKADADFRDRVDKELKEIRDRLLKGGE